ncbi:protein DEHYDRATION-INDUCED 19 homolog 5-like isoform X3 [Henckelia pumila]|uniref:protein DEHYDRATION-INDUCED 19 homolog 5-like isoform X3 n=1 Tax=Henckelia pumila TaxID=405737 RepID=UPI003C6E77BD
MDVDFWAARVHSAKNIANVQPTRLSYSGKHGAVEEEAESEVRAWFPCPFCYVEIEVLVLCIHLQEEHCFDLKNARRKKSLKSGFWSNVSPNVVKDLRELSSFLGTSSATSLSEPAHDPLLSPFLYNVPLSVFKGSQKGAPSCIAATSDATSTNEALSNEVDEQKYEEKNLRAKFIQELVASAI